MRIRGGGERITNNNNKHKPKRWILVHETVLIRLLDSLNTLIVPFQGPRILHQVDAIDRSMAEGTARILAVDIHRRPKSLMTEDTIEVIDFSFFPTRMTFQKKLF